MARNLLKKCGEACQEKLGMISFFVISLLVTITIAYLIIHINTVA